MDRRRLSIRLVRGFGLLLAIRALGGICGLRDVGGRQRQVGVAREDFLRLVHALQLEARALGVRLLQRLVRAGELREERLQLAQHCRSTRNSQQRSS